MQQNTRSSLSISYQTWTTLFLREAIARLSVGPEAIWIFLNPIMQLGIMLTMFVLVRVRSVDGIDVSVWLLLGIFSYDMFRDTEQAKAAIKANKILFNYRQIRPIDTVLVKACLEGFLTILVAIILFTVVALFGVNIVPENPLAIVTAMFGLWLIGLAAALTFAVTEKLLPATVKVLALLMRALYMLSGVILPLSRIPLPYRDWLLFNPLLHGVEAARSGFAPFYHAIPGVSIAYLYICALCFLFIGLALQKRFYKEMLAK